MANSATPIYSFVLPEVGSDADAWGTHLNTNWSNLDTLLNANGLITDGSGGGTGGSLPLAGGTMTGPIQLQNNPPSGAGNMVIGYASNLPGIGFDSQRNISIGPAGNMNFNGPGGNMGHFDTSTGDFYTVGNLYATNNAVTYFGKNSSGYPTLSFDANHNIYIGPSGAFNFMRNGSIDMNIQGDLTLFNGHGWQPGGGSWISLSDARTKDVLGDYTRGLADILMLEPRRYRYRGNDDREHPTDRDYVGLIAQEVEDHWPGLVRCVKGSIDGEPVDDLRVLDTSELVYALVRSVQALHQRLRALER